MNQLSLERRTLILRCLTDGCSLRATSRITGHARNTISKFLIDIGQACWDYQDKTFQKLRLQRLESDEIWAFCGCKDKGLKRGKKGLGSIWTWVAFDPVSKLIPVWHLGKRGSEDCKTFINDLAERLVDRFQFTTDGHETYPSAVEEAFGADIDYGALIKEYEGNRYTGKHIETHSGQPDPTLISTSGVERINLEMRMNMRRYTRKTNGFSKKLSYMSYAVALHFMAYNFVKIHGTLECSPAMAAGISTTLWEMEDLIRLLG